MEDSILDTTKKTLGLSPDYTPFDLDVIVFINSVLSDLDDLGIGPDGGLTINGAENKWGELGASNSQLNRAKAYVYLKVRMLFDPPSTSFHIEAMNKQIERLEWLLNRSRESALHPLEEEIV